MASKPVRPQIRLSELIGGGYDEFWNTRCYYRLVKGSKGSKKSKTTALWFIYHIMKYPLSNALVVRKVYGTMRDSCFADLLWAIDKLGVSSKWEATTSPLRLTYYGNNQDKKKSQTILFKGLDDPYKVASINVHHGYLCWVWFEEFSDITNEYDFEKIDMSIRGLLPPDSGLFKQITCTFNPWSEHLWIKPRFFDTEDENIFATTTTYKCNEFLGPEDIRKYENLYIRNPRQARIICDGEWGISEGLIYDNWEELEFNPRTIAKQDGVIASYGLDFGFHTSANAFTFVLFKPDTHELWVCDEMYSRGVGNYEIAKAITKMGYAKETIIADSASPKDIWTLRKGVTERDNPDDPNSPVSTYVLPNIRPALKGKDSVKSGIRRLQEYHWYVHPKCQNTITELQNYAYKQDKDGKWLDEPIKEWDHCLVGDTPVLTLDGYVPIKEIRKGDLVMTHLGPQLVTAAGITQLDARIWRMELEDGTVLNGTWNHPIVTEHGVCYLKDVSVHTRVPVWKDNVDVYPYPIESYINNSRLNERSAEKYSRKNLSDKYDSLHTKQPSEMPWVSQTRMYFVNSTSSAMDHPCKFLRVISVQVTDRREPVYDLTVDLAHDFFANGILTLNCMDSIRYSSECILTAGKGHVVEVKGNDAYKESSPGTPKTKSRRVASTI